MTRGLTLDTGALIALERGDRKLALLLTRAHQEAVTVAVPTTALAQAIRDPARQVPLGLLLRNPLTVVDDLDRVAAVAVGRLLAASGTSDITDAHVAVTAAHQGHAIVTSDRRDLATLAPGLPIVDV